MWETSSTAFFMAWLLLWPEPRLAIFKNFFFFFARWSLPNGSNSTLLSLPPPIYLNLVKVENQFNQFIWPTKFMRIYLLGHLIPLNWFLDKKQVTIDKNFFFFFVLSPKYNDSFFFFFFKQATLMFLLIISPYR